MPVKQDIILELKNIVKDYPGVRALDHVSISFKKGEVHALVGENGAGKSTLIKVCTGAIAPTGGEICVNGKKFESLSPSLSLANGIAAVYQEFNLVQELSIAENIFLGEKRGKRFFNHKDVCKGAREYFTPFAPGVPVSTPVKNLSVGYQQMVEIAKAVSKNARILIMDEPSAPLTSNEVESMFQIVETLKSQGVTIIYISHRLEEIFRIADRVTIMRDGQYICTKEVSDTNKEELIQYMVGRELNETYPAYDGEIGEEVILDVQNLTGNGLEDISFQVRKGEILGLGGLVGAGRTELAQMLFGLVKPKSGKIIFRGQELRMRCPRNAISNGIALVPEDRKHQGLVLNLAIGTNISMACMGSLSRLGVLNRLKERQIIEKYKNAMRIKTSNSNMPAKSLSGGNQQKVVLAKWMATEPELIIFDEPTRGIDVGAKYEIYLLIHKLLSEGKTLIMISSEMEELVSMSDRIVVLAEGRKTGELERKDFNQETILAYSSKSTVE